MRSPLLTMTFGILGASTLIVVSACTPTQPSQGLNKLIADLNEQRNRVPIPLLRPTPRPGTIVFYQIDGGFGSAKIFMNRIPIADLREKRYFVIQVPPGRYSFDVSKLDQGRLDLNVQSGWNYYIKNSETFGGYKETLRLMDVGTANSELGNMKLLDGKDVIQHQYFVLPAMRARVPAR